jgi:uncharacterized protein with HEPN domain
MFDRDLAISIISQIRYSIALIQSRFVGVLTSEDFLETDSGLIRLDAICMQLIVIGENVKALDRVTDKQFLPRYPEMPWKRITGMRDMLSHNYFTVDAEVVFQTCSEDILELDTILGRMLNDLDVNPPDASTSF